MRATIRVGDGDGSAMKLKTVLLAVPLLVLGLLLQAYFWVPSYDSPTVGGSGRLSRFILGSIGDAQILNPILNADTASSRITGLVFDGLLRLDEDGALEGRLARSWTVTETAYLLVDTGAAFADGTPVSGPELVDRIAALEVARAVSLVPPEAVTLAVGPDGGDVPVSVPARVEVRLDRVDQDLLRRLEPVLGADYGAAIDRSGWVAGDAPDAVREALAARFPVLTHNPEITFALRDDVRFHDGEPFDAEDVVFTYEAIMDPRNLSPRTSDYEPIERIDVLDPHTVRVVYKRLFSPAINAWTMGMLPAHLLKPAIAGATGMRDLPFNRAPIGTGPFRFVSWQSDELIRLTRNDDYWDAAPLYAGFDMRVIPDLLTQEMEFRTGAVDAYAPQPHQTARYREDDRYQTVSTVGASYSYIGYNNRRPLLADRRVRQALGMAIDVDAIIRYVMYGEGRRVTGPYPIITRWNDPDIAPLPYDPKAALALLGEAGWTRNADGWLERDGQVLEFNLITNNGNPIRKAIMTIAQQAWRDIGVRVNTQVFEWTVFLSQFVNTGDFDAVILGWSMGSDPDLFQLWHSSQSGPRQLNFVGYDNPEADRLIERIRQEYDADEQQRLTRALHAVIAGDQPYTFLMTALSTLALDRKIVMVDADGRTVPVRAGRNGEALFFLDRWRKLPAAPAFDEGS